MQQPKQSSLERLKQQSQNTNNIIRFIRSYQLKQKALTQLVVIYSRHFYSQHFSSTFKSAIALLVLPSLTNIYYAVRSHSILAGIMPFAMPLICISNYLYFFNEQMRQFSLTNENDAEQARKQYEIIYQFSYYSRDKMKYLDKLQNFKEEISRNKQKIV